MDKTETARVLFSVDWTQVTLGVEFGSTRVKAVAVDPEGAIVAVGGYTWENQLVNGVWTYALDEILHALQAAYAALAGDAKKRYGAAPSTFAAIGISGMMHGFLALDADDTLLTPFQTWRNSNTEEAADQLTEALHFAMPLRWTGSHLFQRVLDGAEYVKDLAFVTTLSSYIHYRLTGEKVVGAGEASGIFPLAADGGDYDADRLATFDALLASYDVPWTARELFPVVHRAGEEAGRLTAEGALLLDPSGALHEGIPFCPPEGDAGTGMVATNAVKPGTGNCSAGTSAFAMLVLERPLAHVMREIDLVATPEGLPVAMAHANNGTTDINHWAALFSDFARRIHADVDMDQVFETLFEAAGEGDRDAGGLLSYGYYSGEGITHVNEGRPLFAQEENARFTLANVFRAHLYSVLACVKMGLDQLKESEGIAIQSMLGHGGLFRTKGVAQQALADAIEAPVTVLAHATEGGAWGSALLARYMLERAHYADLGDFLAHVFEHLEADTLEPQADGIAGWKAYMERYEKGLRIEEEAIAALD